MLFHGAFNPLVHPGRTHESVRQAIQTLVASHTSMGFDDRDGDGRNLLHCACIIRGGKDDEGAPDPVVVRSLLDAYDRSALTSTVVNSRDHRGYTPLMTLIYTAMGNQDEDEDDVDRSPDREDALVQTAELLLPLTEEKPPALLDTAFHLGYPKLVLLLLRAKTGYTEAGMDSALQEQGTCGIDAVVEMLLGILTTVDEDVGVPLACCKQLRLDLCKATIRYYVDRGMVRVCRDDDENGQASSLDLGSGICDMLLTSGMSMRDDDMRTFLTANVFTPEKKRKLVDAITSICHAS